MHPEKPISINEYEYNILNKLNSDIFTTSELRELFTTACSNLTPIPEKRIYPRVYYLTKKLLNAGALNLISCKPGRNFHFYKKSCVFHKKLFKVNGEIKTIQPKILNNEDINLSKPDTIVYKSFIKRINYYKKKMEEDILEMLIYGVHLGEHPALNKIKEEGEIYLSQQINLSFREIKKLERGMAQLMEINNKPSN